MDIPFVAFICFPILVLYFEKLSPFDNPQRAEKWKK